MENKIYQFDGLFNNIIPVTAVVIAVAVLFFIIYYFIYRFYINKKILKGDRTAHSSLTSPAVVLVTVGVILCIAAYYVTQYKLQILAIRTGDVYSVSASASNLILDERLQYMSTRIAKNAEFAVGQNHPDTKTFDLKLTIETDIVPGKNDKLTFRIGDSKSELKMNKDGKYSCIVQASIFKTTYQGILTLESDGDKISEIISNNNSFYADTTDFGDQINALFYKSLPYTDSEETNVVITRRDNDTSDLNAEIKVIAYPSRSDENDVFTEMKLVFEQDGKALGETDLINSKDVKKNGNEYACTFEGVIKNEHKIDCYVLAKDKNGFTYKLYCRLNNDIFNNNSDNIIYDTDGNEAARFYSLI